MEENRANPVTLKELQEKMKADKIEVVRPEKTPEERFNELISGNAPAPNEFVAYLLQNFKQTHKDIGMLEQQRAQLRQQLTQIETQIVSLRGQQTKTIADIEHWDREVTR